MIILKPFFVKVTAHHYEIGPFMAPTKQDALAMYRTYAKLTKVAKGTEIYEK